jgi:mxaJ protein
MGVMSHPAWAATPSLRICAGENELPYSNQKQEGFENKVAQLLGEELGRPIEYVWWKDPRYVVRDLLDKDRCDVIMGLDSDDPRVATTTPYYRSGYAFIYRKDKGVRVEDWNSHYLKQVERIAVVPYTPAEVMLRQIGRYSEMMSYIYSLVGFKAPRNQYVRWDPAMMVGEVASGKAEVAVLWAPEAARFVQESNARLEMTLTADNAVGPAGAKVPQYYSTSLAVRKDNQPLLTALNKALERRAKDIAAILKGEGIPLLPRKTEKLANNL